MIKTILVICLLLGSLFQSQAQLILVGADAARATADGYAKNFKVVKAVKHGDLYYFISPNGYLYQAGRTPNSLKVVYRFTPQNSMFFEATNNYIYYSESSEGDGYRTVTQFQPATGKINYSLQTPAPYEKLSVNGIQVPGYNYTVSEMFPGTAGDKLLIRTFKNDILRVFAIHDENPSKVYEVHSGGIPDSKNANMNISVNSSVMDRGKDVFVNGRSKPSGSYENTSTVLRLEDGTSSYSFLAKYILKDRGISLFDDFLKTDTAIYSFCKSEKDGKTDYQLFRYHEKQVSGYIVNLSTLEADYAAQVIGGTIYISNKGEIGTYSEKQKQVDKKFKSFLPVAGWSEIQKGKRFLKAGNYLMAKIGNEFQVLNEATRQWNKMKTAGLAKEPNRFRLSENYAYAGKEHFFFVDTDNGGEQFTSFDPVANTYSPISFPAYKKETFTGIKGIFQQEDGFIILTGYADKKGKAIYRVFNYLEEKGSAAELPITKVEPTEKKEPKPVKVIKEKSPHKISDKSSRFVFEENFKNNNNNWVLDKSIPKDSATAVVKSGALLFDNNQNNVAFVGINVPAKTGIKLATDEEFVFKANVKHISGVTNSILGIHFGEMINGNITEGIIFATDADKNSYAIYEKRGANFYTIKSWTIDAAVKKSGNANELQVVKRVDRLSFFINGKFVYQTTNRYPFKAIGFIIQNKQAVSFDDISITSFPSISSKTERDQVNDLVTIFKASDSSFKKHYLPSGSFKKESWLPVIGNGTNQFYIYEGVPSAFEKTGVRYAPYYENTSSSTDSKATEVKSIQMSKLIEAGLENYTKREITTVLGKTIYWQSNNPALPNNLIVALENFEISGNYFTKIIVVQAANVKLQGD